MPKPNDAEQAAAAKAAEAERAAAAAKAAEAAESGKPTTPKRKTYGKVQVLSESKTHRVLQDDRFVWKEAK